MTLASPPCAMPVGFPSARGAADSSALWSASSGIHDVLAAPGGDRHPCAGDWPRVTDPR